MSGVGGWVGGLLSNTPGTLTSEQHGNTTDTLGVQDEGLRSVEVGSAFLCESFSFRTLLSLFSYAISLPRKV